MTLFVLHFDESLFTNLSVCCDISVDHKKETRGKHEKELQAQALNALNSNLRPWTLVKS